MFVGDYKLTSIYRSTYLKYLTLSMIRLLIFIYINVNNVVANYCKKDILFAQKKIMGFKVVI